jgi:hypothetical protein
MWTQKDGGVEDYREKQDFTGARGYSLHPKQTSHSLPYSQVESKAFQCSLTHSALFIDILAKDYVN